jgi:hypothetical protein
MKKRVDYRVFEALDPLFKVVLSGLSGLVDRDHYFDVFAEDATFESRYYFPGWPVKIEGRANLMASLSGYGKTSNLHSSDALVVHRSADSSFIAGYFMHDVVTVRCPTTGRFSSTSLTFISGRK